MSKQAFPQPLEIRDKGMTLREYFAGQALAHLATYTDSYGHNGVTDIAVRCVQFADALIKELEKQK